MKSYYKKSRIKVWKNIIIILAINLVIMFGITKIIYDACFPRYDAEVLIPEELELLVEERQNVEFLSGDYLLNGYLYGNGSGRGLVVIAPGMNASVDNYLWQIQSFTDYGWDVFSFDTTGSCTSEGTSAVGFSQELLDLDAALTYVEKNYKYDNIFIFGHSRGGYSACCILGRGHDIAAVVSVGGINSAMEAIMQPAVDKVGFIAYGNYPLLYLYQTMLFGDDVVSLQADKQISESEIPAMIVQGINDTTVPADSISIYAHRDEITSVNAEYYVCDVPGQDGHTDLLFANDGTANNVLMDIINQFYSKNSAVSN
ncbi:MAG: alpha/beta hydrolase [Butyrivibrio sp.]